MDKIYDNIDYQSLLNIILDGKDYEELVTISSNSKNLLEQQYYRDCDEKIKSNFDAAVQKGIKGRLWEQSEKSKTFRHVELNTDYINKIRFRLYLCPKDESLYMIVNELLRKCLKSGERIYLKYSRENRYDKIVLFLENNQDLSSKLKLLEHIKKENPAWFFDMKKSDAWLSESSVKGVFMAPEKITKRDFNVDYPSYTKAFESMMINVRNELCFHFKTRGVDKLKQIPNAQLLPVFKKYFLRELGKMGLFVFFDEHNKLCNYINSLFPGYGKSTDEDICLTEYGLEIGKRVDMENKEYFKIPFGTEIPMNPEEYKMFDSYVIDNKTDYLKKLYPGLYNKSLEENGTSMRNK